MQRKQNMFLPYPDLAVNDDVIPSVVVDPNTVYNIMYDENIEDDFLK